MRPTTNDAIPVEGRRARLVPVSGPLLDELYGLASVGRIPWQWSGPTTPHEFQESIWRNVLVQFAIEDMRTGKAVGLVRADRPNLFHGFAYLTMILLPEYTMRAWPLEAAVLFGNFVFMRYNLENLYAEADGDSFSQYQSGVDKLFEVEAHFRDRLLINGKRQDQYVLKFTRERAMTEGAGMVDRLAGRDA